MCPYLEAPYSRLKKTIRLLSFMRNKYLTLPPFFLSLSCRNISTGNTMIQEITILILYLKGAFILSKVRIFFMRCIFINHPFPTSLLLMSRHREPMLDISRSIGPRTESAKRFYEIRIRISATWCHIIYRSEVGEMEDQSTTCTGACAEG